MQRTTPLLAHPLLRHWLRSQRRSSPNLASTVGLTLLEALVAMIIISVIISVITPPVFIAVATRVYQRKTEQALNIAQQEIDAVRRVVSAGDYTANNFGTKLPPAIASGTLKAYAAPTAYCVPTDVAPYCTSPTASTAVERGESSGGVAGSTDSSSVFYVQVFRDTGTTLSSVDTIPSTFRMAVRVYEARPGNGVTLGTDQAPLTFTTGKSRRTGNQALPLAVLYTEVSRGDVKGSLNSIQRYLTTPP
jgi:type II secretory pathway pseudopilin PulG